MKTAEIKDLLKKDLLIVEAKYEKIAWAIIFKKYGVKAVVDHTLLGSPDEIKEDDVKGLVKQSLHTNLFAHYVSGINPPNIYQYKTALESFNSAIESEIHWVNPFSEVISFLPSNVRYGKTKLVDDWKEAQEKTFDRNRVKIFVKN